MKNIKLISLDTRRTKKGWEYFENAVYINSGVINLDTKDYKKIYSGKSDDRVKDMCMKIIELLKKYQPDIILIEKLSVSRNMVSVRQLSKIIGAVYTYSILNNCWYYEIQPSEWRGNLGMQAKGRKRDEYKKLSIAYVKNNFNIDVSDDEADSICAAVGYINMFT